MKRITELAPVQQQMLLDSYQQYHVLTDPLTNVQYIRFMGEDVEYRSITQTQFLQG